MTFFLQRLKLEGPTLLPCFPFPQTSPPSPWCLTRNTVHKDGKPNPYRGREWSYKTQKNKPFGNSKHWKSTVLSSVVKHSAVQRSKWMEINPHSFLEWKIEVCLVNSKPAQRSQSNSQKSAN